MKRSELVHMIREEVVRALNEAPKKSRSVPKTFAAFRKIVADAMAKAGAPEDMVEEVADVGYEGGSAVSALYDAWQNIEAEMEGEDDWANWTDMVEFYVHDAVIDIADAYRNPMNYEPGRRPKKVNASTLAKATVAAITS